MSDPQDLRAFLNIAWQHITRGVADARAPARYPTFATVSPDGIPQARTVALRAASQTHAIVEVHTDLATAKVAAIRHAPIAALHIWIPRADLQIRITASVEILVGTAIDAQWAKVPSSSRVSYGTQPEPGTPIDDAFTYEKPADRDRFAVLHCALSDIDLVHLEIPHRRAAYAAHDGWAGCWLAP